MGFPLFLRYLFFRSFPHIFERFVSILMAFYLFSRNFFSSRSSNASLFLFLKICSYFVPIIMVLYLFLKYLLCFEVLFIFLKSFFLFSPYCFWFIHKNVRSTKLGTKSWLKLPRGWAKIFQGGGGKFSLHEIFVNI